MIESKNEVSKDLEKALQALEQAKQRVANEKKKQNEKRRKTENLINRMEHGTTVFTDDERNLIVNYNYKLDDMEKTRIPGTWGEGARFIWIPKADIMDIYNGKKCSWCVTMCFCRKKVCADHVRLL